MQKDKADSDKSWTVDGRRSGRGNLGPVGEEPERARGEALRSPEEIIADMLARDAETAQILEEIRGML